VTFSIDVPLVDRSRSHTVSSNISAIKRHGRFIDVNVDRGLIFGYVVSKIQENICKTGEFAGFLNRKVIRGASDYEIYSG
jgi:hypothetical protein